MVKLNTAYTADIAVTIEDAPAPGRLEALWRTLEGDAAPSFFLSWTWIDCWLRQTGIAPGLVVARSGGAIVGLGLVHRAVTRRHLMTIPTLLLHETGQRQHDLLAVEYNGFLAEPHQRAAVTAACLAQLPEVARGRFAWRELAFSGIEEDLGGIAYASGLPVVVRTRRGCPLVDLGEVRAKGGDHLALLSRNTRQQMRRTIRHYGERGPLAVTRPRRLEQAMTWFDQMAALHQRGWTARGMPGAFANPFYDRFHRALLAAAFAAGTVDLLKVTAGGDTVGVLYNLIHRNNVYCYQSGFAYEAEQHARPGMLTHCLALADYVDRGLAGYHFMAGDSRYKSSLATGSHDMLWLTLQRDGPLFKLERLGRHLLGRTRR